MQRYFIDNIQNKLQFAVTGDVYHHIVRVMRMKIGQQVYIVDEATQTSFIAELIAVDNDMATLKWVADEQHNKEMPVNVTIACGVPKGDKIDWLVKKATELGASAFQFFQAERSDVKWDSKKQGQKIDRLQKIAREAAEQSHRQRVPLVKPFCQFKELLTQAEGYDYVLIAYEESAKAHEMSALKQVVQQLKAGDSILVVFGPEGGLSVNEVSALTNHHGQACGLGPRILRAETAPLYVLSAISFALELQ